MAKSPYTQVNKRQRLWANPAGELTRIAVPMHLDSRGDPCFVMILPGYVVDAMGAASSKTPNEVRSPLAGDVECAWEKILRKFEDHMKTASAVPVLLLDVEYTAEGLSRGNHHFTDDSDPYSVSVGWSRAFRINGGYYAAVRKREPGVIYCSPTSSRRDDVEYVPGHKMRGLDFGVQAIDWTPEIEAQIKAIRATITTAAGALRDIVEAKDVGAALLGMGSRLLGGPKVDHD